MFTNIVKMRLVLDNIYFTIKLHRKSYFQTVFEKIPSLSIRKNYFRFMYGISYEF